LAAAAVKNIFCNFVMKNKSLIINVTILVLIVFAALYLRQNTFWLAHWKGDQEHYLALAMKLDRFGLEGYNLRGVDVRMGRFNAAEVRGHTVEGIMAEVVPAPSGSIGYILNVLLNYGVKHYDNPLHHVGPGFPYALIASNKLFGKNGKFTAVNKSMGRLTKFIKPPEYFKAQFYSVIVPLFFSLGLIVVIFLLGKALFSAEVGLLAAFLQSVNAVDLLSSQRLWTDGMTTFFVALSVLWFVLALRKDNILLSLLSGLSLGVATLARQNVLIAIVPVLLFMFAQQKINKPKMGVKKLFSNRLLIIFVSAFLVSVSFWFWKVFKTYGNFFFMPSTDLTKLMDGTRWYGWIEERPHPLILYTIGMICVSPIFVFAFALFKKCYRAIVNFFKNKLVEGDLPFILLFTWFLVFFISFTCFYSGKEHRYLLPAYPALSILSAYGLFRFRKWLCGKIPVKKAIFSNAVMLLIIGSYVYWSIYVADQVVLSDKSLIIVPF